jgi:methyl-accepting chemotaxis protein
MQVTEVLPQYQRDHKHGQKAPQSLRSKLVVLMLAVALLTCLLAALALYMERTALLQDRQDKIRNLVEVAYTQIKGYEDRAAKGELDESHAQQLAADTLASLRYDNNGYYFAFDKDLVISPMAPSLSWWPSRFLLSRTARDRIWPLCSAAR